MIAVVDNEYIVERLPKSSGKYQFRVKKYVVPQYFESTESDPTHAYRLYKRELLMIKALKIDGKTIHRSPMVGLSSPPTYQFYIEGTRETFYSSHINIVKAYQEHIKGEPMEH